MDSAEGEAVERHARAYASLRPGLPEKIARRVVKKPLMAGAVAVASDFARVLPPLVMDGSRRLAKEWEGAGLDPALLTTQFLTSDTDVILDAQQCRSYPLLGRYRGQMKPFEVPIQ